MANERLHWAIIIFFIGYVIINLINPAQAQTRKKNVKDGLKRAYFDDFHNWKHLFSNCDPKVNPNASPVNIIMDDTVHKSTYKPIIVFGGEPSEECLFLSMIYKKDELEMEALNIFPDPSCTKEITYISGAGESPKSIRYFRKAFILFSKTPASPPQSLHQLDGKSFDMEISMEFSNEDETSTTEVHILVEALPSSETPANPAFKAIEDALVELEKEVTSEGSGQTNRSRRYKYLNESCDNSEKAYFEAFSQHEKLTKQNSDKRQLQLNELNKLISSIKNVRDEDVIKLMDKVKNNITISVENKLQRHEEQRQTLIARRDQLTSLIEERLDKNNAYEKQLKRVEKKIVKNTEKISKMKRVKSKYGEDLSPSEVLRNVKKLLARNKVGVPGETNKTKGNLFDSPDAIYKERDDIIAKLDKLREAETAYDSYCSELVELQKVPYAFVSIQNLLQISWLFPHYGGYFLYSGSSPLPDCEKRNQSIVFDTPIKITTEQLQLFHNLPSLYGMTKSGGNGGDAKVDKMLPILYEHGHDDISSSFKHQFWHVPKNPVFVKDDGFHIKYSRENKTRLKQFGKGGINGTDRDTSDDTSSGSKTIRLNYIYNAMLCTVAFALQHIAISIPKKCYATE